MGLFPTRRDEGTCEVHGKLVSGMSVHKNTHGALKKPLTECYQWENGVLDTGQTTLYMSAQRKSAESFFLELLRTDSLRSKQSSWPFGVDG